MRAWVVVGAPLWFADGPGDVDIQIRRGRALVRDTNQIYDEVHGAIGRSDLPLPLTFTVDIVGRYDRRAFRRLLDRVLRSAGP